MYSNNSIGSHSAKGMGSNELNNSSPSSSLVALADTPDAAENKEKWSSSNLKSSRDSDNYKFGCLRFDPIVDRFLVGAFSLKEKSPTITVSNFFQPTISL